MTCVSCGAELPVDAMFCGECGRAVAPGSARAAGYFGTRVPAAEPAAAAEPAVPAESAPPAQSVPQQPLPPLDSLESPYESTAGSAREATAEPTGESTFSTGGSDRAHLADTVAMPPGASDRALLLPFVAPVTGVAIPGAGASADLPDVHPDERRERFVLQFSTGESVTVYGGGLLGRHPVAQPSEVFDVFVAISDPGKSVSKTHLEFGQDDGAFWVSDRYSANGSVVREPETAPRRCEPGKRYRVSRGGRVDIGDQFLIVS